MVASVVIAAVLEAVVALHEEVSQEDSTEDRHSIIIKNQSLKYLKDEI